MKVLSKFLCWIKSLIKGKTFLCDTCLYDWGEACTRPQRPNARECPDYRRRV